MRQAIQRRRVGLDRRRHHLVESVNDIEQPGQSRIWTVALSQGSGWSRRQEDQQAGGMYPSSFFSPAPALAPGTTGGQANTIYPGITAGPDLEHPGLPRVV